MSLFPPEPIETPCIRVCLISGQSSLCIGCGRSLKEIARWGAMTPAERAAVMAALPARDFKPKPA